MKINWLRVGVLTVLCGAFSGIGMPLIVGVVGLGVGFIVFLGLEFV